MDPDNNHINIYYNSGNVGIGTDNPIYKLEIRSDGIALSGSSYLISKISSTTGSEKGLIFGHDSAAQLGTITSQGANSGISFWTHNDSWAERIRIDTSGNVGIGTTSPGVAMKSEPMEINGRKFHQPGTLIGKALEPLEKGKGAILVLLSLQ